MELLNLSKVHQTLKHGSNTHQNFVFFLFRPRSNVYTIFHKLFHNFNFFQAFLQCIKNHRSLKKLEKCTFICTLSYKLAMVLNFSADQQKSAVQMPKRDFHKM